MSKTILIDYYRDSKDTECLNSQYYDDDKNFANLPTTLQFLHVAETIAEYGKEALEGKQLEVAKKIGFVTDHSNPDNSNPDNSLFTTVANAFSSIPKEYIFFLTLLATSHAAHAYRHVTFNTPDNSNADNFDIESSDVVHHRSARALPGETIEQYTNLENQNCVAVLTKQYYHKTIQKSIREIHAKCFNEPCNNQQFNAYDADYLTEVYNIYWLALHPTSPEAVDVKFSIIGTDKVDPYGKTITYSCKTEAYSLVQEGDRLFAEGKYSEAGEQYNNALKLRGDYSLAVDGNAKVLAELAKTTTAGPTSSTSNEASSTATSTEASTVAKNTTQAESSTPTAPQDQTTPSAEEQGWLWNKVGAPIVETAAGVFTIAAIAYVLHKLKQCYNKTKEVLDIKLADCNGHGLLESDQFIPSNDNGDAKVIQDLSVSLTGDEDLVT
ncbi:MAG: hypothetical protein LN563_02390 [Rickettsia endosymbiont of Platyusa sonomae]|nr:hypothetical protein [Rickettsia endosymbiont of Platyusa sonomae]